MMSLLNSYLQLRHIFILLCRLEALLRMLPLVSEGVSTHDIHVMNTVHLLLLEFLDYYIPLLFQFLSTFQQIVGAQ